MSPISDIINGGLLSFCDNGGTAHMKEQPANAMHIKNGISSKQFIYR